MRARRLQGSQQQQAALLRPAAATAYVAAVPHRDLTAVAVKTDAHDPLLATSSAAAAGAWNTMLLLSRVLTGPSQSRPTDGCTGSPRPLPGEGPRPPQTRDTRPLSHLMEEKVGGLMEEEVGPAES